MSDSYSELYGPDQRNSQHSEENVKKAQESRSVTLEQAIYDVLSVLYIIHTENQSILMNLGKKETADKFGELVDTHIKSYQILRGKEILQPKEPDLK